MPLFSASACFSLCLRVPAGPHRRAIGRALPPQQRAASPGDAAPQATVDDNGDGRLDADAIGSAQRVRSHTFDIEKVQDHIQTGDVAGGFAFVDTAGTNYVIFTTSVSELEDDAATGTLRIRHLVVTSDATRTVRDYVEFVRDCPFDIVLEPKWGDWSVSDVDDDGIAETSFAYSAACVSDVSPVTHKVIVAEGGQEYALRGETYLRLPNNGDIVEGGAFRADPMPTPFREAAVRVWEATAYRSP